MHNTFFEYYHLNSNELSRLWKDGLVVLDTNVLLSLYRRPLEVREDIVKVLKSIRTRIWIPHQVGLEFHNHRLEEANRPIAAIKGLEDRFRRFESDIQRDYENNPYLDYKSIKSSLAKLCSKIQKNATCWLDNCPDFLHEDKILNELTELFDGRVGESYSEPQRQEIYKEGEQRYGNKIPPGFKDGKKQLGDQSRFGDLIIWYQMIEKAKSLKTDIIFVTDDQKEDWWDVYDGFKTGPCHELIREFQEKTDNQIIWFYTTERFLKELKSREKITVKPKTIEDVKRPVIGYSSNWLRDAQPGDVSSDSILGRPLASFGYSSPFSISPIMGASPDAKTSIISNPLTAESDVWRTMPVLGDSKNEGVRSYFGTMDLFSNHDSSMNGLLSTLTPSKEETKD